MDDQRLRHQGGVGGSPLYEGSTTPSLLLPILTYAAERDGFPATTRDFPELSPHQLFLHNYGHDDAP